MTLASLKYIAIEGVIGAGKTTLADMLSKEIGAKLILEEFESNPFLEDFYQDPVRYAFQAQTFFLLNRFQQQQRLMQADIFHQKIVSDYIFEKDRIFATLNLNEKEMVLYDAMAKIMEREIVVPDLVIYLQASTAHLIENIRKRNRPYETNISEEYIRELNELYNRYFFNYNKAPLLVIKTDEINFKESKEDFKDILVEINHHQLGTRYYVPQK
jgi:deoxyadenosine/deoxycytidine kinase